MGVRAYIINIKILNIKLCCRISVAVSVVGPALRLDTIPRLVGSGTAQ